jgi:hypothetical protein
MHFSTKSYLKNTRNHTAKHTLIAGLGHCWNVLIGEGLKKKLT